MTQFLLPPLLFRRNLPTFAPRRLARSPFSRPRVCARYVAIDIWAERGKRSEKRERERGISARTFPATGGRCVTTADRSARPRGRFRSLFRSLSPLSREPALGNRTKRSLLARAPRARHSGSERPTAEVSSTRFKGRIDRPPPRRPPPHPQPSLPPSLVRPPARAWILGAPAVPSSPTARLSPRRGARY